MYAISPTSQVLVKVNIYSVVISQLSTANCIFNLSSEFPITYVFDLWKSSDQSLSEKKLHTSPKSTTSQDFQTVLSYLLIRKVCKRFFVLFSLFCIGQLT